MSIPITNKEFIARAASIHGNKYNYDNTNYINRNTKVIIICPEHGNFRQCPAAHISQRQGCPTCGKLSSAKTRSLDTAGFIEKSKKLHGDRYNYSKVNCVNGNTKIIIGCKKHGDFSQTPLNHLQGNGCNKCRYENHPLLQPKSTPDFVLEAKRKHNNKYNYSLVNYKQAHSKVTIICLSHGKFYQTPRHHLNGDGCPKCIKRISFRETQFLDYIHIPDTKENRQVAILGKQVDGIDLTTNTIYEFLGDYWHGNPEKFKSEEPNKICHKSYGELYNKTIQRLEKLKEAGYNVKYIWENDWKRFEYGTDKTPRILVI